MMCMVGEGKGLVMAGGAVVAVVIAGVGKGRNTWRKNGGIGKVSQGDGVIVVWEGKGLVLGGRHCS